MMIDLAPDEMVIDNFAGGGGATEGIEIALGRPVDVAINHDAKAVAMHKANHRQTLHLCQSVYKADPLDVTGGRPVGLAWFSPDCTHFSKAKGGKPVKANIRDLAWVVILWAQRVKPRVIFLENVEEFRQWGPLKLNDAGELLPDPEKKGFTFRRWVRELKACGYKVEWREIRAQVYGAPTIRKRLYLIARCDGQPIRWPAPTHGPGLRPYPTAASHVIDWSQKVFSIFLSREEGRAVGVNRPLAENTMARIARGVKRYVIDAARPFIVPVTHAGDQRVHSVDEAVRTLTTANGGELAFVAPTLVHTAHGERDSRGKKRGKGEKDIQAPMPTGTASPDLALVAATMVQTGYGERKGQQPRSLDIQAPLGTAVAGGGKHALVAAHLTKFRAGATGSAAEAPVPTVTANSFVKKPGGAVPLGLVAAFLAQHNGGPRNDGLAGHAATEPLSTIATTGSQQQVVSAFMLNQKGSTQSTQEVEKPTPTVCASTVHAAAVLAFMQKYYGTGGQDQAVDQALHTIPTKGRYGLTTVLVEGEPFEIVDIGMRMLTPRELFRAQGFRDSYIIDIEVDGRKLSKADQIRMCGNSVCPPVAAALVRANFIKSASSAVEAAE